VAFCGPGTQYCGFVSFGARTPNSLFASWHDLCRESRATLETWRYLAMRVATLDGQGVARVFASLALVCCCWSLLR